MSTVSGTSSSTTSTSTTTSTKNTTLGQDQFLTLLVAQLKHQDPLNPSDPTEFTSQLAQYSQLEQLFDLNDSMDNLTTATASSERYSALSLINQDVVVEGSTFTLGSDPVELGYKIDGTVSSASLVIKNSAGKTVATLDANDLTEGNHFLTWDGTNSKGNSLAAGSYSVSVEAKDATGASATVTPLVRTTVTGVDLSGSEASIVTNLGEYKISSLYGAYANE